MLDLRRPSRLLGGEELIRRSKPVALCLCQRVLRRLRLGLRVLEGDAYALVRLRLHRVDRDLPLLETGQTIPSLLDLVGGGERLLSSLLSLRRNLPRRLRSQTLHLLDLLEVVRDSRLLLVRVPHLLQGFSLRPSCLLQELSLQPPGVFRRVAFHPTRLDGVLALKVRKLLLRRPGPLVDVGDRPTAPRDGGVGGGVLRVLTFTSPLPSVALDLRDALVGVSLRFAHALLVVRLHAPEALVRSLNLRRLRRVFRADGRERRGQGDDFVFVLANLVLELGSCAFSRDHRGLSRLDLRLELIAQVLLDVDLALSRVELVGEPREPLLFRLEDDARLVVRLLQPFGLGQTNLRRRRGGFGGGHLSLQGLRDATLTRALAVQRHAPSLQPRLLLEDKLLLLHQPREGCVREGVVVLVAIRLGHHRERHSNDGAVVVV